MVILFPIPSMKAVKEKEVPNYRGEWYLIQTSKKYISYKKKKPSSSYTAAVLPAKMLELTHEALEFMCLANALVENNEVFD